MKKSRQKRDQAITYHHTQVTRRVVVHSIAPSVLVSFALHIPRLAHFRYGRFRKFPQNSDVRSLFGLGG